MEKRNLILAVLIMAAGQGLRAQDDDFGIWSEVNVEKKINRQLTIDGGVELRTRDNVSEVDRWSGSIGADYKLTNWLKASISYSLLYDNNDKEKSTWGVTSKKGYPKLKYTHATYWGIRHRFNLSLTASKSFGNLSLSLRERWQYTYRPEKTVSRWFERWEYRIVEEDEVINEYATYVYDNDGTLLREEEYLPGCEDHTYNGKGKNVWRNRLQAKYKVNRMWRPYVAAETFVAGGGFDKLRMGAGTEIRLTKKHWLDVKYLFQKAYDDDDDEGNRHVIGIGYTYKF